MRYHDGLLSVSIQGNVLDWVLAEIARQSGIAIHSSQSMQESISVRFSERPLEDGLKRILRNYSYSLMYTKVTDAVGQDRYVPSQLIILQPSTATAWTTEASAGARLTQLKESPPAIIDSETVMRLLEEMPDAILQETGQNFKQMLDLIKDIDLKVQQDFEQDIEASGHDAHVKVFGIKRLLEQSGIPGLKDPGTETNTPPAGAPGAP